MSDDSNVTMNYYSGFRGETVIALAVVLAVLFFSIGRLSVPPSAEAIAHKQEMERIRSEQAAAEAEAVGEALAMSAQMMTATMALAMEADGEFEVPQEGEE